MNYDELLNLLRDLELRGATAAFERLTHEPCQLRDMPPEVLLGTLLTAERNERLLRQQQYLLKIAHIPYAVNPGDISYDTERGTDFKARMTRLLSLDFIKLGQNLTVFGSSGTGKSFIAAALARQACLAGMSTLYSSTAAIIANLQLNYGSPSYYGKLKTLNNKALVVLDDFCLTEYDCTEQTILFDILNGRYGRKSTLIISQKLPEAWLESLGATALAQSIVERAGNNNFTLILKGDSRRHSLD